MSRTEFYEDCSRLGTTVAARIAMFLGVTRAQVELWIMSRGNHA